MSQDTALQRLAGGTFLGLAILMVATFYWGFLRSGELSARPDNPRRIAADRHIQRGALLDRWGTVLATTDFTGTAPLRRYPVPAAAPVVGFQTWRYGAGAAGRTYGAGGAEAAYDAALRGDIGLGHRDLLATRLLHRPQQGFDVHLTLDAELQSAAAAELGSREGAVVVVAVNSGAVRAMVSWPTFDPAALDAGAPSADDPQRPMFNRATQGLYPPGSTWKTVTLAAALAEGIAGLDDEMADGDVVEHFAGFPVACTNNPRGVAVFDLAHAFGWSCNVTFARLGARLGAERFTAYTRAFGSDDAPPFDLPVAASSSGGAGAGMALPELASAAFGQGRLLVTPLHMALIAAAVAGDGHLPVPTLVHDVPGAAGHRVGLAQRPWRRAVDRRTASAVRSAMTTSVREGWAATAVSGLNLSAGGKTGTAQVEGAAPHSWFIGFAPADDPLVAVAVLVAHGGEGSRVAAPIGGRVLAAAVERELRSASADDMSPIAHSPLHPALQ